MARGKEIERQKACKESEYFTPQVRIKISTDLGYTAQFLRQLADEVEAGEPIDFELYRGVAAFEWPNY